MVIFQGLLDIKEHQLPVENAFLQRGLATLSVEQPGVGECTLRGMRLSRRTALETVEAVMAFLCGRLEIDSGRIGVFGFSLGGYLAALMAAHNLRIRACATVGAPARFAFAHGGKDDHPYPVDRKNYDQSILFLRETLEKAKVGDWKKLEGLRRLARWQSGKG